MSSISRSCPDGTVITTGDQPAAVGFNLALLIRKSSGIGKPRTLQGLSDAILLLQIALTAVAGCWVELIEDSELPFGSF